MPTCAIVGHMYGQADDPQQTPSYAVGSRTGAPITDINAKQPWETEEAYLARMMQRAQSLAPSAPQATVAPVAQVAQPPPPSDDWSAALKLAASESMPQRSTQIREPRNRPRGLERVEDEYAGAKRGPIRSYAAGGDWSRAAPERLEHPAEPRPSEQSEELTAAMRAALAQPGTPAPRPESPAALSYGDHWADADYRGRRR